MKRRLLLPSAVGAFTRCNRGAVTVEFILWVPIIFTFWFGAVQIALLFVAQSTYISVASDTARLVARHALDIADAVAYAETEARLFGVTPNAAVTTTGDTVTVTVSVPALAITALNPLGFDSSYNIVAAINQTMEPM